MASGRVPRTAITLQGFGNWFHSTVGGAIRRATVNRFDRRLAEKTIRPDLASAPARFIDHLKLSSFF